MFFGRTDLRIDVSKAKLHAESDFEVCSTIALQKPDQNQGKHNFRSNILAFFFRRQKIKCWESSETRFPKFSRRSEPCLRGKRPFKVLDFFRNSRNRCQNKDKNDVQGLH